MSGNGHADCSPSTSGIWMNCPASVTLARGKARKPTAYTREGTLAHLIAEGVLKGQPPLSAGEWVTVDGEAVEVTEEMLDIVRTYTDIVAEAARYGELQVEKRVSVSVGGEPLWGTADAIIVYPAVEHADVYDLKAGGGVYVAADGSQPKIYGLGALEEVTPVYDIKTVSLNIVQPRQDAKPRTVTFKVEDLLAWKDKELVPAIRRVETGDTTETPGDWCRWCVRAGECKALADLRMAEAKAAFGEPLLEPKGMTDAELGAYLDMGKSLLEWVAQMRGEASDRIDRGSDIPGWKLVAKRAMRKWVPDMVKDAIHHLVRIGVPIEDITRIETITNVEKVLKRMKKNVTIDPFTAKESSGTTLVSEKDGRPALDTSAQSVFSIE